MTYYKIVSNVFSKINKEIITSDDFLYEFQLSEDLPLHCSFNINMIKSHNWNIDKYKFMRGNTSNFRCKICKIGFVKMLDNTGLDCNTQLIKNIIE